MAVILFPNLIKLGYGSNTKFLKLSHTLAFHLYQPGEISCLIIISNVDFGVK